MLSVMTVVLPQHSKHASTEAAASSTSGSVSTNAAALPSSTSTTPRCQSCDCRCIIDRAKNRLSPRCPVMKGYMVDSWRHHILDPSIGRPQQSLSKEWDSLREAACFWKDKYERLYESQKRLQKVNESLEEKLLRVTEKFENEKCDLTRDVSDLTSRLVEARLTIAELEEENEQYRNDCNIAVRLLQCKPSSFVAHKFNSLPADFQAKVKRHLNRPQKEIRASSSSLLLDQCPADVRTIKVSVPTLPPAAMVYSVNKAPSTAGHQQQQQLSSPTSPLGGEDATPDHVSAAIIAKVLEERSLERKSFKNSRSSEIRNIATQTDALRPVPCPRCHSISIRHRFVPSSRSLDAASKDQNSSGTETAI